uniref:Plastid lipid-associated protein/fibrillin conserved domain-containing protein n=1 Tax=Picea sitchensis TaxID=3332 RepID=A9NZP9_PICSI|nr:unknown [Picea sitchensis]ABR17902.1 unknown [Picea sitchensis]
MAAISSFSAHHYANSPAVAQLTSGSKPAASAISAVGFAASKPSNHVITLSSRPLSIFHAWGSRRTNFRVFAIDAEDEWSGGKNGEEAPSTVTATVVEEEPSEMKDLKRALVDSFYGTDRGLRASSETRAEIVELITQLEAKNPTPAPTEALNLLNGKWILVYTSFSELFPLLATGTLPLVKVQEISQKFDSGTLTVENSVQFAGPLATTSFSTNASFEVRSPKRVQIKFEEGVISTPQLTDAIEIPESVEVLGKKIDLAPFKGLISSVQNAASSVVKSISERPPIKFPIRTERAQSWLLTTYLDEDLRISRGDGSSVFVLIKEGSPLLPPS